MKHLIKLVIVVCSMFVLHSQGLSAQSTSAERAFERGITAYNNEQYAEALPYLKQAALAGVPKAYKPLISLYVNGDYDGSDKGNYKEAFSWLLKALDKYMSGASDDQDLTVACIMYYDPLCFLTGDYQETVDHATKAYSNGLPVQAFLMNQIAASYLKLGNRAKANEWLTKAIALATEEGETLNIYTSYAILSKIAMDNKDYSKALDLSVEAASKGEIPLAAYVLGVCMIKTNYHPEIGQKWVKLAAEYDYGGISEINCFENEIKQYWYSIKDLSF